MVSSLYRKRAAIMNSNLRTLSDELEKRRYTCRGDSILWLLAFGKNISKTLYSTSSGFRFG